MRELIRTMPAATGATVLISSHLLGEMEQMVEHVGIIDHGRMLFEGPLTELQRHSKGALTLRLLHPAKALPVLQANGLPTAAVSEDNTIALPPLRGDLLAGLVQDMVKHICFVYMKNESDTEDVFQDVFLKYALFSEPFQSEEHKKAWLIRVTVNRCKDLLRSFFRTHTCSLEEAAAMADGRDPDLSHVLEAVLKVAIFLTYMVGISKMKEIHRVFEYHGAEHKTIACYEAGDPLTVENVRKYTRFHPRCGTSFLILVVIVSVFLYSVLPWSSTSLRVVFKLLLLPVVMGISYELLKWCGRSDNIATRIIRQPGIWVQHLTVFEPDDSMIEVAIAAVTPVLPEDPEDGRW